ncbi:ribosome-associated translation inhibitor RaiA [Skermanella sp. TT6]|uniref:Ribosome-associated translation inhibitor RaiA n=1 Tax=Skermanella cutis TaxID=2775420 RepID=A0ABX7B4N5_9PROT|nr:ribosome-associated translation inhibitor RaiA [Skermanella sp. TT6]QQP89319.1 ribosome-associated translation inhibitor RaiA [Skermanella sp. TT6]
MKTPLKITFKNLDPSPALKARIGEKAAKLERFCEHIVACRVVVERPHGNRQQGNLYQVTVGMTVPGGELVADGVHEDAHAALRAAFDAAVRRLEDHVRRQRLDVKRHEPASHQTT